MTADMAIVPATAAADRHFVARVVDLVNRVYAEAEKGLWQEGAERTDAAEIGAVVRAGELVEARLDGELVGVVHIAVLDGPIGEFGMLVAAPEVRSTGTMQLELLVPPTWTHPVKEFLHGWYTRIGYRPVRTEPFDVAYPALAPRLATPCDFVIYQKSL